jgi:gelsolin
MALFGSPLEKEIKKHAAEGEPAWKTAGKAPGLEIWRVEKFKIVPWPKDKYGKFYDGDSYIVLHTMKVNDVLKWDVHFWLGQYTTQDEAGTAAYKTVELDDSLNGAPVQYREVQGSETEKFLHLFDKDHPYSILSGGVGTGFTHVDVKDYRKRLLQIKGTPKRVVVREVPAHSSSLNKGDAFLLDLGLHVIQFVGAKAGIAEKSKATQLARALDDERGSKVKVSIISESDSDEAATEFWNFLGGKAAIKEHDGDDASAANVTKKMFQVHHEGGKPSFKEVKYAKSSLTSDDVYVVDAINTIYIWVGKGSNADEKKLGFSHAQNYLNGLSDRSKSLPIVKVMEGGENEEFHAAF